ncbi:MAG: tyrosine-protein phosphatase [Acidimicrobiia bacterium]
MAIAPGETSFERHLAFDGCFNFRDLGGYRTRDGHALRPRRLFRADGPHALTDADGAMLRALSVTTVLDLRTTDEATERGHYAAALPGVLTYPVPMTDVLPDVEDLPTWTDPRVVATRYHEMLVSGHEAICESLAILTDPEAYPAMMHCSAGKDRTGILSAIVLGLLGVPDETIVDDYALSGPAMIRFVDHLQRTYPDARERLDRIAPAMVTADPQAMQRFIAGLRAAHGSFEGYADDLGMAPAVPYLRANLLDG